ncbi:MAG: DNA repair protein RecO [Treponema sp.]|jgi:DNA repair protein RecO (recombination protein O)|nr:DNA repair protein RecO [Treponema sp.]
MNRTPSYNALILRARPSGESNREITLFTAEEGLLRATVFGGPKSRLRAYAAPYHQGTVWLYRDPVKDSLKVTDFDVLSWRPGIREDYDRTMAAAAVAETILASHGGGTERTPALALAGDTLDALETGNGEGCRRLVIQFLWNWAGILGCRPDLRRCASCGKVFTEAEAAATLWYSRREGSCFCPSCSGLGEDIRGLVRADLAAEFLPAGPGARRWLFTAENLKPSHISRVGMDRISQGEARALCTAILSAALGKALSCWAW